MSWISLSVLTSILVIGMATIGNTVVQVEIGAPGVIVPVTSAALAYIGPAFEEAVTDCNHLYSDRLNFSLSFLVVDGRGQDNSYQREITEGMVYLIPDWYYTKRRNRDGVAVIITGGAQDTSIVHQLTASWDILYMITVAYRMSTYTLSGPPPLVTSVISVETLAATILNLVEMYNWTTIFRVIDDDSPAVYLSISNDMDVKLRKRSSPILQYSRNIRAKRKDPFPDLLREFQTTSRVMVFLGRSEPLRRLMSEAASQNLTNGHFVFICAEPYHYVKQYGNYTWQYGDAHDQTAREAFRSLLTVHPLRHEDTRTPAQLKLAAAFGRRIRARVKEQYDISYPPTDQPLWDAMSTYSTIKMYCQVLNDSLDEDGLNFLKDGRKLANKFLNTTFHDEYSDIFIDSGGIRRTTLVVSHTCFGVCPQERKAFLIQPQHSNFRLQVITEASIAETWPDNAEWPPKNEPTCGYQHEKLACQVVPAITRQPTFIAIVAVACLLVMFPAFIFIIRWYLHSIQLHDEWWLMDAECIVNVRPRRPTIQLVGLSKAKRDSEMFAGHEGLLKINFADFDWSRRTSEFSEEPVRPFR